MEGVSVTQRSDTDSYITATTLADPSTECAVHRNVHSGAPGLTIRLNLRRNEEVQFNARGELELYFEGGRTGQLIALLRWAEGEVTRYEEMSHA